MAGLTNEGFVCRTPEEIKLSIVKRLQQKYSSFLQLPADVQNNIIDTGIESLMEYELLVQTLCNSFALNDSNEFLFRQMAESLGLAQKSKFKAQVELTFTGKEGTYIPPFTLVSTADGTATFETQESAIIDASGVVNTQATGEATKTYPQNSFTNIVSVITNDETNPISVTNNSASLNAVSEESFDSYKARAQAKLRGARKGGIDYAVQCLRGLEGVDNRLVGGRAIERKDAKPDEDGNYRVYNAIEMVVGGGSAAKVANVLYQSFFEFQKLASKPSDDDTSRSVTYNLLVLGQPVPIIWTRPKEMKVSVQVIITLGAAYFSGENLTILLEKPIAAYINSIEIGADLSKVALTNVVLQTLLANGLTPAMVRKLDFKYAIGEKGSYKNFPLAGYADEVDYDCYLVAERVQVSLE